MQNPLAVLMLFAFCASCTAPAQRYLSADTPAYESQPLTKPDQFSHNIEGPSFRHDTLFVVNYQKDGTIGMVFPDGRCELYATLPDGSTGNSIKFDAEGNMYVADFTGHNILKIDKSKSIQVYCHDDRFHQPNDLCINSRGWLYASDPGWADSTGQLWLIKAGQARKVAGPLGTTNGLTLSPDEKQLYVGESVQRKIWVFDVAPDGSLSNKKLFATFKDYDLDGMHFGPNGNLFVCRYGKGTVVVFSPQGKMLRSIPLKGKNCSNLVFGDPDGKTVFVTLQDTRAMEMFRID